MNGLSQDLDETTEERAAVTAFEEGQQAFKDGLGRNRNPHADATSLVSRRWDDGWTWTRDKS